MQKLVDCVPTCRTPCFGSKHEDSYSYTEIGYSDHNAKTSFSKSVHRFKFSDARFGRLCLLNVDSTIVFEHCGFIEMAILRMRMPKKLVKIG